MQEIASNVYIETGFTGLTLGVVSCQHGMVLIDAPFRVDDARTWRSALLNLGGGVDRLLVNMDAHVDRTLGVRVMDCIVVGHEKMAEVYYNRPAAFKTQIQETGAEWEIYDGVGSTRWVPPEITFTNQLNINWGDHPLELLYCPGSAAGAITVKIPTQKVIFIGDIVTINQPPFLANADLPLWIGNLQALLGREYHNYLIVSGRDGLVTQSQVQGQLKMLQKLHDKLENLGAASSAEEAVENIAPQFISEFKPGPDRKTQFERRLRWGLKQYFQKHYMQIAPDPAEDEV